MPIQVCFVIQNLGDGGAQIQLARLAIELQQDPKFSVSVVYFEAGSRLNHLQAANISNLQLSRSRLMLPLTILKLRRFMNKNGTDILSTWLAGPDVIGRIAIIGTRLKWVIAERNSNYEYRRIFRIRAIFGKSADLVIANSSKGADYWRSVAPKVPGVVIPNIVNVNEEDRFNSKVYDVVSVGRFVKQKNPQLTARVLAEFARRNPETSVGMIGQGQMFEEVETLFTQNGWPTNLELPGYVIGASQAIVKAKVLVLLSSHEGQPNVVMEAVVGKTIPVVSRIPEHVELLGADYPYLVDLSAEPTMIAEMIKSAMQAEPSSVLGFAQAKLANQTPAAITAAYKQEFERLVR